MCRNIGRRVQSARVLVSKSQGPNIGRYAPQVDDLHAPGKGRDVSTALKMNRRNARARMHQPESKVHEVHQHPVLVGTLRTKCGSCRDEHTIVMPEASPCKGLLYILYRPRYISHLVHKGVRLGKSPGEDGKQRTASVSSILRTHFPPCLRTNNWLTNAVRNPPRCSGPVGEGANLSSGVPIQFVGTLEQNITRDCRNFSDIINMLTRPI